MIGKDLVLLGRIGNRKKEVGYLIHLKLSKVVVDQ